ncbi:hypothetical protein NT2_06_00500 [Caenibius tardaugens NBRC 16725]|uniref:GumN family protein n=1 Tax=Caenibius tardaugens NBRC 16725 TaxID=1219035 RepID=U2Y8N0_9SPHN|nr:TraB/GumN family protein [Caenibius tardaugens]GAD49611.1 hypothetical protein NT2_06_00500 [Caenibius tardaugens NBRC 16725]
MNLRSVLALAAMLLISACSKPPEPATPAFWEVTAPDGQQAWLFGTIHALPENVEWRSPAIEAALAQSDTLLLEIRQLDDRAAMQAIFTRLAETPGQATLSSKVTAANRPALVQLLQQAGISENQFARVETWAAALTLAQAARKADNDAGVDRTLITMAGSKPVAELEGTEAQLRLFDTLPEKEQRDLLNAIVAEAADARNEERIVEGYWRRGDIDAIAAETHRGMMADPELRAALLVDRNRAWSDRIAHMIKGHQHPFVAVGAAHMAGPEGLPALLAGKGFTVRRVQ